MAQANLGERDMDTVTSSPWSQLPPQDGGLHSYVVRVKMNRFEFLMM
jgi:hypothetical protein|tara:strand:- start:237 stop:377 length:141 start_codon:yes stop_codon:yes gene_type:complete